MQPPAPSRPPAIRTWTNVAVVGLGAILVVIGLLTAARPGEAPTGTPLPPATAPATPATAPATAPAEGSTPPGASPSAAAAGVTLIAAGDIGRCDATTDDATGTLAASLPGIVATLGDTAYEDGTAQELDECFGGSWGAVKDRIRYAITGNHDVHTDGGAPLVAYMGEAAARDGHPYFSEDLGAWHVVVLDANCGILGRRCAASSDQVTWLRNDLAASTARCTLALWHQPRFSSGDHGNDSSVAPFWDALSAAGVELVLNGHDHDYERFAPQGPDGTGDDARGITEIVVGTGGATLEGFPKIRDNSIVRLNDAYGVLELTLLSDGWSFRFLDTSGAVRDEGSGTCH